MQIIYDIIWLLKNIILSTIIIIIFHFILEYLRENYDFDFFENYFNKQNIIDVYANTNMTSNMTSNLSSNLSSNMTSNMTSNLSSNMTSNLSSNLNENNNAHNKINMDEELKNIINKKINNNFKKPDTDTDNCTSINDLPIVK